MPLPNQLLTMAEKSVRDTNTGLTNIEETIVHYIDSSGWKSEYEEINRLFAAVEGIINFSEYKAIFGSTNQDSGADTDFMYKSKLQNHNILMGIAKLLIGEFGTRSHEYEVVNLNPNDDISRTIALNMVIKEWHKKKVLMEFQKVTGMQPSEEQPMPELEKVVNEFNASFNDSTLIKGQEALDFIRFYCSIDFKLTEAFYDYVVTGGCITYKDVINNEVVYEHVPRNQVFILNMKEGSPFIEDAEVHIRRRLMTPYSILEMLQEDIEEDQIKAFQNEVNNGYSEYNANYVTTGRNGGMAGNNYINSKIPMSAYTDGIEVFHVVYTSFKDVYILSYIDEFGMEQEKEVIADYELIPDLGDISISKEWYTCKLQGYKVMDYFFKCGEVPFDRSDVDSKGNLKSCYNGIVSRTRIGEINSIIKEGLVYQRTINVLKFSMEKLINKNKDKVLVMPYGLVPRSKGISTAKQAYHMDATSVLWIDEAAPNASFAAQMIKSIDMSLNGIIAEISSLVIQTKNEYWEAIGMNAQRYSDVSQYAGKATTEQAIVRSAIITYDLVSSFDKMVEKDYQGLLDISKAAWINGIKEGYIFSDSSRGVFEMNIDDANYHASSNYNVFVKDATTNTRGIEAMRSFAGSMLQNGASASAVSKMYTTNSTSKVSVLLEKMEKVQQMVAEQASQADHERAVQLQEMQAELQKAADELKVYEIDSKLEGVKYTADRMLDGRSLDANGDGENDLPVMEDNSFEEELKTREANRKERMDKHTVTKDNKELELKAKALSQRKTTSNK
jgi:hypothetical protein